MATRLPDYGGEVILRHAQLVELQADGRPHRLGDGSAVVAVERRRRDGVGPEQVATDDDGPRFEYLPSLRVETHRHDLPDLLCRLTMLAVGVGCVPPLCTMLRCYCCDSLRPVVGRLIRL